MSDPKTNLEEFKKQAGHKAAEFIEDGMVLGLGTGSTVKYAIEKLAERIKSENLDVIGIPTSIETEKLAKKLEIKLTDLETHPKIDLTIDGADEVDPDFTLIKGRGGALLREKIVAMNSEKEIIIVDHTKMVKELGTKSPLPVEILPFGWSSCFKAMKKFDCEVELRKIGDEIYISNNKNYLLDCRFKSIGNPVELESKINNIPGVIENGLFIDLTDTVIVASSGGVEVLFR